MARKRRPQRNAIPPYTQQRDPVQTNPQLAAAVFEIVDKQLRDGDPPETRQTLERLVGAGHTPEGARQLIGHVVLREIFDVMTSGQRYDQARFVAALRRLPALPEAADE